jgi:hypothetical protein
MLYNTPKIRVVLNDLLMLPPKTVKKVTGELRLVGKSEGITWHGSTMHIAPEIDIEENEILEDIAIIDSICLVRSDKQVRFLISNPTNEPIELPAGYSVARAEEVDEDLMTAEEAPEGEQILFLHEAQAREEILGGGHTGKIPAPPGYDEDAYRKDTPVIWEKLRIDGVTSMEKEAILAVMKRYEGVLSTGPKDYGKTPHVKFKIDTGDAEPISVKYRPVANKLEAPVRAALAELERIGAIEEAESPWNSGLVAVLKPNGKLRLCVNLKGVNDVTKNVTNYPIAQVEESLAKLCNAQYYAQLDLSQAYYRSEERRVGKECRSRWSPYH